MRTRTQGTRRGFLAAGVAGTGLLASGCWPLGRMAGQSADGEEDIGPVEDLMREHGALRRILLIHDELIRRLDRSQEFPAEALTGTAGIVQKFVQAYHEKLEEDHIFPRFEKAGQLADLARVLRLQHEAGRRLVGSIAKLATPAALKDAGQRKTLGDGLRALARFYRPHAAREDTVLFPAFHAMLSEREYDRLGDQFEDKERELFGVGGFEGIVGQVAGIEKSLGLYDLAQFTPSV